MTDLNHLIWEHLKENLERLSWKCSYCEKIKECEEQATTHDKSPKDYEPRYCESLVKAAMLEKDSFIKPFEEIV